MLTLRVHRQRDVGVGVAELTTHEHDIEPLGDEHAGVPVPKAVQGKPSLPSKPSAVDSQPESVTRMAVVTPTTLSRGEHEVIGALERRGDPLLPEEPANRRGEEYLTVGGFRLEPGMLVVARELTVDTEDAPLVVHVRPGQPERFADPQPRVGQNLEQRSMGARAVQHLGQIAPFEDADAPRSPARFFARLQAATGLAANQPRRMAYRQTRFSVISAMAAVVGASTRSLPADHSAT
jgi:hypothetical protein